MEAKELSTVSTSVYWRWLPIGRSPNGRRRRARITALPADRVLVGASGSRSGGRKAPSSSGCSERCWPTASPAHSWRRGARKSQGPAGDPGHPRAGDHLTLAFRPVHEELAPESRAAQL